MVGGALLFNAAALLAAGCAEAFGWAAALGLGDYAKFVKRWMSLSVASEWSVIAWR